MITVLGDEKIMEVSEQTFFTAAEGYSFMKNWEESNPEYDSPIEAIGKAPLGDNVFTDSIFKLKNGWKIRPSGYPVGTVITIEGTLITDDSSSAVVPAVVGEPVTWIIKVSSQATIVATGSGVTATDKTDIAQAVRAEMDSSSKALKTIKNNVL